MRPQFAAVIIPLKQKIEQLIALHQQADAENAALKNEVEQLRQEINNYKAEQETLEQKIQKLQIAGAYQVSQGDTREAKQQIGKLIREIDKCLAMLNQ